MGGINFKKHMKKLTKRQREKKERDRQFKEWADAIKRMDKCCVICGETKRLNAHHIIPRARGNSVYFLRENIIALCKGCHVGWHKRWSPGECKKYAINAIGEDSYDLIESKKHETLKYSIHELMSLRDFYKEQLKELNENSNP